MNPTKWIATLNLLAITQTSFALTWEQFLQEKNRKLKQQSFNYDDINKIVKPKPVTENFYKNWISPSIHQRDQWAVRTMKRFTAIGGRTFPIANFTVYSFPKKEWNAESMINTIEESFEQNWKRRIGKRHSSLEGYWPGGNRYMRDSFHEGGEHIIMTLYSGRVGYWDSTYPEALTLEKHFENSGHTPTKKTTWKVRAFDYVIARAHAQSFLNLFGGGSSNNANSNGASNSLLGGGNSTLSGLDQVNSNLEDFNKNFDALTLQLDGLNANVSAANGNWGDTNTQLNGANNNWNNTNTQLSGANTNWNNTNNQIGDVNTNWGDTNTQIGVMNQNWSDTNDNMEQLVKDLNDSMDEANANLADTNKIIDKNWQRSNEEIARANDLATKALDPKNVFKLAAATSAGAVLGATLAQTAIDLMVMGAGAIFEAITGAKADAQRWAKFKEARAGWEKNVEMATQLERLLDNFLLSHEMMKQLKNGLTPEQRENLSREEMAKMLSINTRILKKKLKRKEEAFYETDDLRCEAQLALEIEELEDKIKEEIGLKEILEASQFDIYNDDYFCSELPRIFGKLAEAEAMLAQYRLDILAARSQWAEYENTRLEDMAEQMERLNKGKEDKEFTNNLIDNAEDAHDLYVDLLNDTKDSWVEDCKKLTDQLYGKPYAKRLEICTEKYNHWSLNELCAKKLVVDKFNSDKNFHEIQQEKRNACRDTYRDSYLGKQFEENKMRSKEAMQRKIKGYEQTKGTNRRNYLMNLEVENQRLSSFQRFFDDIYEQQFCFETQVNLHAKIRPKLSSWVPSM